MADKGSDAMTPVTKILFGKRKNMRPFLFAPARFASPRFASVVFACALMAAYFLLPVSLPFTSTLLEPAQAADNKAGFDENMPIRGIIRAANEAKISTELATLVSMINFEEGESFHKGDILIALDCRRTNAELQAARARQKETAIALRSTAYLVKRGAGSRQELDIAQAQAERAKAEVDILATRIEQCQIKAPYDGAVLDLKINAHEMTVAGQTIVTIVSLESPHIELIVPSNWLVWLKPGTAFRFRVDETQAELRAVVDRLGAKIDAASQTIKIYARIKQGNARILPGMSGLALFAQEGGGDDGG
jgi:membrane fusion protein, multidrug efflux system